MFIRRLKPTLHAVFVLHESRTLFRILERVFAAPHRRLERARDWMHLRALYEEAVPATMVIADPFLPGGERSGLDEELLRFLGDFPACALAAPLQVTPDTIRTMLTLHQWGVTEIIDAPRYYTDPAMAAVLSLAAERRIRGALEERLPIGLSPAARVLITSVAVATARGCAPSRIAGVLRAEPETLGDLCARRGLPEPERLAEWIRLAHAARLLDEPARRPASAAAACRYADEGALEAAAVGLVGLPVAHLRSAGAFGLVMSGFGNELTARGASRRRRGP